MIIARFSSVVGNRFIDWDGARGNSSQSTFGPYGPITRRVPIYLRNCVLGITYLCDIWNRARVEREREQVHNYYSKVSYSADMIYYSVNCLSPVTWVGENLVRNGAIWWNGIPVSCPIFSLWTSVCISTVVIRSIVDNFLYFVNVYPRLLCVMH